MLVGEAVHDEWVDLFDAFDGGCFAESSEGLEGDGAGGDAVGVDVGDDVDGGGLGEYVGKALATFE